MQPKRIVKKFIPKSAFRAIEPAGHKAEAILLNAKAGFPLRGLNVIGVTGTNGKTTTCFMIHRMLVNAGYKAGLMSTVAYGVGEDIKPQMEHMTSVPVPQLLKRIKQMKAEGMDWLVLETTSHALAQYRVWGVPYSIVAMTNITHEHLAYHGTFERYLEAKRKLFKLCNKNMAGFRTGLVNAEDPHAELFASDIAHPMSYGIDMGDLRATDVKLTPSGSTYTARVAYGLVPDSANTPIIHEYHITCNMPGRFNVFNSLAAIGVGLRLGLSEDQIEQGIAALTSVEGRMVSIDEGQPFEVIVDYAHSPDSFEKLFSDMRPVVKGKIIALFGSLGGGDKGKRPMQGEIAGKYADEVVLCQEDDREEDPQQIMNDIAVGTEKAGKVRDKDLFLIHDRTEAIKFAFSHAQKGDLVLLLGKGHEKTQEDATGTHPWDEVSTARQALKEL